MLLKVTVVLLPLAGRASNWLPSVVEPEVTVARILCAICGIRRVGVGLGQVTVSARRPVAGLPVDIRLLDCEPPPHPTKPTKKSRQANPNTRMCFSFRD